MKIGKAGKTKRPDPFEEEQPEGYHYNRRERLSLATAPRFPEKGGIFRRNRALLIILLDLVIVLFLGLFLMRVLFVQVSRVDLQGYSLVLSGRYSDQVVIAALRCTRSGSSSVEDPRIFVRFALERNPSEEQSTYASISLPAGEDQERVLRAVLPSAEKPRVLYAEVRIGDSSRRLSVGVGP